jgi:hypothetical protein
MHYFEVGITTENYKLHQFLFCARLNSLIWPLSTDIFINTAQKTHTLTEPVLQYFTEHRYQCVQWFTDRRCLNERQCCSAADQCNELSQRTSVSVYVPVSVTRCECTSVFRWSHCRGINVSFSVFSLKLRIPRLMKLTLQFLYILFDRAFQGQQN